MGETLADDDTTIAGLVAAADAALATGAASGGSESRREAEALVAAALQIGRATLLAHPERRVSDPQHARVRDWLVRRARGEPLAYLTGVREFWSLTFRVTPDVLVPRPETEDVVARALALGDELQARSGATPAVVDLGTGSGCIALAIAHERPAWRVTATDASPAALRVARGNAHSLELVHVEFVEGRWYAPLAGRRFDLIVSNPPYVTEGEFAELPAEYAHEPKLGLTAGDDGLDLALRILADAPGHLSDEGVLIVEVGESERALVELLPQVPFNWVEFNVGQMGVFVIGRADLVAHADAIRTAGRR